MERRRFMQLAQSGGGGNVITPDYAFDGSFDGTQSSAISTGYRLSNADYQKWVLFYFVKDVNVSKANGDYFIALKSTSFISQTNYGSLKGYNFSISCKNSSGQTYAMCLNKKTKTWASDAPNQCAEGYEYPYAIARDGLNIFATFDGVEWVQVTNEFNESTSTYYSELQIGGYNGYGNFKKAATPQLECNVWLNVDKESLDLTSYFDKYK